MKRKSNCNHPKTSTTLPKNTNKSQQQSYLQQLQCSCQILYDTSLSNISSQSCDCSDCLQANLNAFNDLKEYQQHNQQNIKTVTKRYHTKSQENTRDVKKTTNRIRNQNNNYLNKNIVNGNNGNNGHNSNNNGHNNGQKNKIKHSKNITQQSCQNNQRQNQEGVQRIQGCNQYTNQQLNDFLYITRNRTRKYLQQRNKLQLSQKEEKQRLKDKIKANLEVLKMTAELLRGQQQQDQDEDQGENQGKKNKQEVSHPYKWNHSKYLCQCNGKNQGNKKTKDGCLKVRKRNQLDTNMGKIHSGFIQNRDTILEGLKKQRLQSKKPTIQKCPYDKCLNHHNRTPQAKIQQINKFIIKQSKKQRKKQKKQKRQKQQAQLTKQAKLRAIDIKAKQLVQNSRKNDGNISRTSFKLSIEQFDTFSQLRQQNQRLQQLRKNRRKTKQQFSKEGEAQLQQKIYQNLQEEDQDQFDNYMNGGRMNNKNNKNKTMRQQQYIKKQQLGPQNNQQYSQKILYDAKIKDPSNLKKSTTNNNNNKNSVNKNSSSNNKQTKNNNISSSNNLKNKNRQLSKTKEQEQRKKLQKQIDRKKKQILQEYSKRNVKTNNNNTGKNKQLRQQYNQNIKQQHTKTKNKGKNNEDSYRKNYKYQAGKDVDQINAHGDPLLQEYVYHDGQRVKAVTKVKKQYGKQKQQIFTQNINSLTGKTKLKL